MYTIKSSIGDKNCNQKQGETPEVMVLIPHPKINIYINALIQSKEVSQFIYYLFFVFPN